MRKWLLAAVVVVLSLNGIAAADAAVVKVSKVDATAFPTVDVYVSITDASGQLVRNLQAADFEILEDGRPVQFAFKGSGGDLTIAVVLDKSGSMSERGKLDAAKRAAITFLQGLKSTDKAAVVTFDLTVDVGGGITTDHSALIQRVQALQAGSSTALFDATLRALDLLRPVRGRKAAVILTDGVDSGAGKTIDDVLKQAAKDSTSIFTIGLGTPGTSLTQDVRIPDIDEAVMRQMADATGGSYFPAPSGDVLNGLYARIAQQLGSEYLLSYQSPRAAQDGTRRSVSVHVRTPDSVNVESSYLTSGVLGSGQLNWPAFVVMLAGLALLLYPRGLPTLIEGHAVRFPPLQWGRNLGEALMVQAETASPPRQMPTTPAPVPTSETARAVPPPRAPVTPSRPMPMARLVDASGRIYRLTKTVTTIGSRGADILLVDNTVAASQLRLEWDGQQFVAADLAGSSTVNGAPVGSKAVLRNGDRLSFGRRELRFESA